MASLQEKMEGGNPTTLKPSKKETVLASDPQNAPPAAPAHGSELPIACTLNPTELMARGELLSEMTRAALVGRKRAPCAVELRFRADRGMREALARFVELERDCCSFLKFELSQQDDELVLAVEGPAAAEPVLSALYEATGEHAAHA